MSFKALAACTDGALLLYTYLMHWELVMDLEVQKLELQGGLSAYQPQSDKFSDSVSHNVVSEEGPRFPFRLQTPSLEFPFSGTHPNVDIARRDMPLPRNTYLKLGTLLALAVLAWIVELVGLIFLQRSCGDHTAGDWGTGAQLPAFDDCGKVYRWIWWSALIELPLVIGLASSLFGWAGSSYITLNRFRMSWIGYLSIATVLQMWAANVALNLTDTAPALLMGNEEHTRAWVTFAGFAALSAINFMLLLVLGDDGEGWSPACDPLLGTGVGTEPEG